MEQATTGIQNPVKDLTTMSSLKKQVCEQAGIKGAQPKVTNTE